MGSISTMKRTQNEKILQIKNDKLVVRDHDAYSCNKRRISFVQQRNPTRVESPLTKMQSLIALCGELLRVIFALLKNGTQYDPWNIKVVTADAAQTA